MIVSHSYSLAALHLIISSAGGAAIAAAVPVTIMDILVLVLLICTGTTIGFLRTMVDDSRHKSNKNLMFSLIISTMLCTGVGMGLYLENTALIIWLSFAFLAGVLGEDIFMGLIANGKNIVEVLGNKILKKAEDNIDSMLDNERDTETRRLQLKHRIEEAIEKPTLELPSDKKED